MKKLLVLALALVAGAQLNANIVETVETSTIQTGNRACGVVEGPSRCDKVVEGPTFKCPDVMVPGYKCPACPVCPKVQCRAVAEELCDAPCEAKPKMCNHCRKPYHVCGGCQHLNRHHGRNVEVIEKEVIVERPVQRAAPARTQRTQKAAAASTTK